jgi:hypothetical protein
VRRGGGETAREGSGPGAGESAARERTQRRGGRGAAAEEPRGEGRRRHGPELDSRGGWTDGGRLRCGVRVLDGFRGLKVNGEFSSRGKERRGDLTVRLGQLNKFLFMELIHQSLNFRFDIAIIFMTNYSFSGR